MSPEDHLMSFVKWFCGIACVLSLHSSPVLARTETADWLLQGPDHTLERGLFRLAEQAIGKGDLRSFEATRSLLQQYPLLPYLDYRRLARNLRAVTPEDVQHFLQTYPDTPLARTLRNHYLDHLAKEKQWSRFLELAEPEPPGLTAALRCLRAQALHHTGQKASALATTTALWLQGKSQPTECDPVFRNWREAKELTPALAWQRFQLAMLEQETSLARYLRRYLAANDLPWAERWLELAAHPARLADVSFTATAHPGAEEILVQAFRVLSRRDAGTALNLWNRIGAGLQLSPEAEQRLLRQLGTSLSSQQHAEAAHFLARLPDSTFDLTLREWQLRVALGNGDWATVLRAAQGVETDSPTRQSWQHYWRGRALAELGHPEESRIAYRMAAEARNFHGFLAAERIGQPYRIAHQPLQETLDPDVIRVVATLPALQRMRELVQLGRWTEARREWTLAMETLDAEEKAATALFFSAWEWHDRAIFTLGRAEYWDDIDLRFPLVYTDLIVENAARHNIEPAWAMAVARQESAFMPDVRSSAGALGIMQIMPRTGRSIAQAAGVKIQQDSDILKPENHARLGTYYLRRNLDAFSGHSLLSTAAYNAGSHRVRSWLPDAGRMDADIWIERIPFQETRQYVQRVFNYRVVYALRLGQEPESLDALLFPVTPSAQLAASRIQHLAERALNAELQMTHVPFCDAPGYTVARCP